MKKVIEGFFSFSRIERIGISVTAFLLMLFIGIKWTMPMWVHPEPMDPLDQSNMRRAYAEWQEKEQASRVANNIAGSEANTIAAAELFYFDPNTLDSAGFIRLGMPARAVKGLLNWRSKGKHFYKPEDLKPLYNLPLETYQRVAPFIRIADANQNQHAFFTKNKFPEIPAVIELNTADSVLLDRGVVGIGAILAHKIITRRAALGGFIRIEQLLEIYRFPDSTFDKIKAKLSVDINHVQRMNLNAVTLEQLSSHPYIGEKTAKNILLYRSGINTYRKIEQLREVPLMSEEIYRKIAPYFKID